MVALKHQSNLVPLGIGQQKQERRGGIETRAVDNIHRRREQEAGTPWWH